MKKIIREQWYNVSPKTRIFFENGNPTVVATCAKDTAWSLLDACEYVGKRLEVDAWLCVDDSAYSCLVSNSWGMLDWSGDWLLAEVI